MGRMPRASRDGHRGRPETPRGPPWESVYLTQTSPIPFEQQKPPHIWGTYIYDYTLNADMLLAPFLHGDRTALCVRSVSTEQFLPTKSTKDGL